MRAVSSGLRDVLMWVAAAGAYEPRWTEEIHAEWMRSVLTDRPDVTPAQLDRTRRLMDRIHPHCLVAGYDQHISNHRADEKSANLLSDGQ